MNRLEDFNYRKVIIKAAVTFIEAAVAFIIVAGYKLDKVTIAGAIGAGLSAIYNTTKELL